MARIAGIDIPRNKKVSYSLRYIFGIGLTQAKNICDKAAVDQNISRDVDNLFRTVDSCEIYKSSVS